MFESKCELYLTFKNNAKHGNYKANVRQDYEK